MRCPGRSRARSSSNCRSCPPRPARTRRRSRCPVRVARLGAVGPDRDDADHAGRLGRDLVAAALAAQIIRLVTECGDGSHALGSRVMYRPSDRLLERALGRVVVALEPRGLLEAVVVDEEGHVDHVELALARVRDAVDDRARVAVPARVTDLHGNERHVRRNACPPEPPQTAASLSPAAGLRNWSRR